MNKTEMLSVGYLLLLCFTLGGICRETDPFQQEFAACIMKLYHKDTTDGYS